MQHLRLANYKITKGSFPEIAAAAREGMLGTFRAQPGFIRYGLAETGEDTCVSISLWETYTQAEAAAPVAATWVREHLADRVELRSNEVGNLAFFRGRACHSLTARYLVRAADEAMYGAKRAGGNAVGGAVAVPPDGSAEGGP